ncbi:MAG: Acyl-CoA dehydrogenase family protein 9, partial [Schumannella sp.]|nr:Acyl-CoA dehydrogenase family protein 9 [Schumannella sp.]
YLKKTEREVGRELRGLEVNDDKYVALIGRSVRDKGGYPFQL